jgi:hypothetical protein
MKHTEEGEDEDRCNERNKKIRWKRINKYKRTKKKGKPQIQRENKKR